MGRKEVLAIADGYRESAQSWREVLLGLKRRGLVIAPEAGHRRAKTGPRGGSGALHGGSGDPIALARIMKQIDHSLDDPRTIHDLAKYDGPRFPGQPLGSEFDEQRLVERGIKQS